MIGRVRSTGAFRFGVKRMIDKRAIHRYHKRVDARLAARGKRFDGNRWEENKHPRAKDGKFASENGGGAEKSENKSTAGSAASTKPAATPKIELDGPAKSKEYADAYAKKNPEIAKEAKKFKGILNKVKDFKADEDGTFSATTGERLDLTEGFCVTFHQNLEIGNEYGAYDDDTYAKMCAISKKELGSSDVYIGYYGNPEVSFNCPDEKTAMDFAVRHNQKSIYNCKTGKTILNKHYNPDSNPIEGDSDG